MNLNAAAYDQTYTLLKSRAHKLVQGRFGSQCHEPRGARSGALTQSACLSAQPLQTCLLGLPMPSCLRLRPRPPTIKSKGAAEPSPRRRARGQAGRASLLSPPRARVCLSHPAKAHPFSSPHLHTRACLCTGTLLARMPFSPRPAHGRPAKPGLCPFPLCHLHGREHECRQASSARMATFIHFMRVGASIAPLTKAGMHTRATSMPALVKRVPYASGLHEVHGSRAVRVLGIRSFTFSCVVLKIFTAAAVQCRRTRGLLFLRLHGAALLSFFPCDCSSSAV